MDKPRWADMTDDDPFDFEIEIEPTPVVTKHGIKVSYVPPHLRGSHKSSAPIDIKERKCQPAKSVARPSTGLHTDR
jgi:hypothetical protein